MRIFEIDRYRWSDVYEDFHIKTTTKTVSENIESRDEVCSPRYSVCTNPVQVNAALNTKNER